MCSCYQETADWIRKSHHPDFMNRPLDERSQFSQKIDSLMVISRDCFKTAKERYHIQEKQQHWSKSKQDSLSLQLSIQIEQRCPNVAKMLSGKRFYE